MYITYIFILKKRQGGCPPLFFLNEVKKFERLLMFGINYKIFRIIWFLIFLICCSIIKGV